MKKYLLALLLPILLACDNEGSNNNNPYIPNYSFSYDINTNLPLYNQLTFAGNAVYIGDIGARGVYVFNTGSGYNAFDAACPNQELSSCSTMTQNGIYAVCDCDGAQYSFYTGISEGQSYPMKQYRVQVNGASIRVYN
ncbi:MAG TPA: hypothetical protein VF581_13855 [Flavobacterium sp.]|jgi:nitrite reductase/ring-hydroxylating ferredoxin subunit